MLIRSTLLQAAVDLIKDHQATPLLSDVYIKDYRRVSSKTILSFLQEIGLLNNEQMQIDQDKLPESLSLEQAIFLKYIKSQVQMPGWLVKAKVGTRGLEELIEDSPDIFESLELTGIFEDELDENAEQFLIEMRDIAFQENEDQKRRKTEVGRRGEHSSYMLEKKKTSRKITKEYIKDDNAGYDIKIDGNTNFSSKYIEVKSSGDKISRAVAEISRGQITMAKAMMSVDRREYFFHFWSFHGEKIFFAEISAEEMSPYFSDETSGNVLRKQGIFFKNFTDHFQEIYLTDHQYLIR